MYHWNRTVRYHTGKSFRVHGLLVANTSGCRLVLFDFGWKRPMPFSLETHLEFGLVRILSSKSLTRRGVEKKHVIWQKITGCKTPASPDNIELSFHSQTSSCSRRVILTHAGDWWPTISKVRKVRTVSEGLWSVGILLTCTQNIGYIIKYWKEISYVQSTVRKVLAQRPDLWSRCVFIPVAPHGSTTATDGAGGGQIEKGNEEDKRFHSLQRGYPFVPGSASECWWKAPQLGFVVSSLPQGSTCFLDATTGNYREKMQYEMKHLI